MTTAIAPQETNTLHPPPRSRISVLLALLWLIINIGLAILGTHSLHENRHQIELRAETMTLNLVRGLDVTLSSHIEKIDLSLLNLVDALEEDLRSRGRLDRARLNHLLETQRQRLGSPTGLRVTDASGLVILGPELQRTDTDRRISYADRDFFKQLRQQARNTLLITDPIFGRYSNVWVISFVRRYNAPDGSFAGVISAAVPVDYFTQLLAHQDLGRHGVAVLRDSQLRLITRYPQISQTSGQIGSKGFSPELQHIIDSGASSGTYHSQQTADGIERSNAYQRMEHAPFHLIAGLGSEDYLSTWRDAVIKTVMLGTAFAAITLLLTLALWRFIQSAQSASERARLLLRNASDGIHILESNGQVSEASESFCAMLGYSHAEMLQLNVADWEATRSGEQLPHLLEELFTAADSSRFETRHKRRDGRLIDVEVTSYAMELDGRRVLFASARDITERKQLDDSLRQSEARLRQLFEANTAIKLIIDPTDGQIVDANQAACQFYGHDRATLVRMHISDINSLSAREIAVEMDAARSSKRLYFNFRHRLANGELRDVEVYSGPIEIDGRTLLHSIIHDVTERRQAEAELENYRNHLEHLVEERTADLEEARRHAEHLAQVKSRFLANMSHEIRTPLNGVLGLASIGMRKYADQAEVQASFAKIQHSGQLLLGVLNDILDFSKIEAGMLKIEQAPTDLRQVVNEAVALLAERAEAKQLPIQVQIADTLPQRIVGDPLRLAQVTLNLLSNAIKFTDRGQIGIHVWPHAAHWSLEVSDTGIGMQSAQIERIFAPFEQADDSTTRRFGGTGLGLTITHRLVELMGGSIQVDSQLGQGSRFTVTLPLQSAATPLPPHGQATPPPPQQRLAGLHILIAEDNDINQLVLAENLAEDGARLTMANNGEEAVAQVRETPEAFDCVLMDMHMPVMDGLEATRQIRALAPVLPIIGQTAYAQQEERAACLAAGMVDHLAKPLDPEKLVETILRHTRPPLS